MSKQSLTDMINQVNANLADYTDEIIEFKNENPQISMPDIVIRISIREVIKEVRKEELNV